MTDNGLYRTLTPTYFASPTWMGAGSRRVQGGEYAAGVRLCLEGVCWVLRGAQGDGAAGVARYGGGFCVLVGRSRDARDDSD